MRLDLNLDLDGDLAAWIRTAIANPGAIAGFRHGPDWPTGHEGEADEQETLAQWQTRAVLRVLHAEGRPMCEHCEQVIRPTDAYRAPLPGIGLWEHTGPCPAADDQTAGATR